MLRRNTLLPLAASVAVALVATAAASPLVHVEADVGPVHATVDAGPSEPDPGAPPPSNDSTRGNATPPPTNTTRNDTGASPSAPGLRAAPDHASAPRNGTTNVTLDVSNPSASDDDIALGVTLPYGWSASMPASVFVRAGGNASVRVLLAAGENAQDGNATFRATGREGSASATVRVTVRADATGAWLIGPVTDLIFPGTNSTNNTSGRAGDLTSGMPPPPPRTSDETSGNASRNASAPARAPQPQPVPPSAGWVAATREVEAGPVRVSATTQVGMD